MKQEINFYNKQEVNRKIRFNIYNNRNTICSGSVKMSFIPYVLREFFGNDT